jgi:hypothetical protein
MRDWNGNRQTNPICDTAGRLRRTELLFQQRRETERQG